MKIRVAVLASLLALSACHKRGDKGPAADSKAPPPAVAPNATAPAAVAAAPRPGAWGVGDVVQVQKKDRRWYEAQIVSADAAGFKVLYTYDDAVEGGVARARLRRPSWARGDGVEAQRGGRWQPVKITAVNADGTYDVAFKGGGARALAPSLVRGLRRPRRAAPREDTRNCPYDGEIRCHGVCVKMYTDPRNCGGCRHVCPQGYYCNRGSCTVTY